MKGKKLPLSVQEEEWEASMAKVYVVDLTPEEREELLGLLKGGQARVRKTNRARILLLADEGRTDKEVAEALLTSVSTVERTRKRFVEGGLERALNESPRPGGKRKLDGHQEAYLVALACSDPPEGKKRWSMQLLADRLVEVGIVEEISDETVRLDFSDLGDKGVGYALVTAIRQRRGDRGAYPTYHDDTAFGSVRATILETRLAECPSPLDGRDPRSGPANNQLCLARGGIRPTQTLPSLPSGTQSR